MFVLLHKPTGGFLEEPNTGNKDKGGDALESKRKSPCTEMTVSTRQKLQEPALEDHEHTGKGPVRKGAAVAEPLSYQEAPTEEPLEQARHSTSPLWYRQL